MYNSQFAQDKWVDDYLGQKENGIFLDIGGCRPIKSNNTYFFEKNRGWTGVIVEANRRLIEEIKSARPNSTVLNKAIWDEDDLKLDFNILKTHYSLSSVNNPNDLHYEKRANDGKIETSVKTITISSIFEMMGWDTIDYLSLDVEGAEVPALLGFKNKARCVTIEHNDVTSVKHDILDIMEARGYERISDEERGKYLDHSHDNSKQWFWCEDWYVLK